MTKVEEDALRDYCNLSIFYNSKINIFGFKGFDELWHGGILPSLELSYHIPYGSKTIDIGSGGGIPAIPLAICRKDCTFTMIEPRKRKCLFLYESISKLGLKNCFVYQGQSEMYFKECTCDVITMRGLRPTKGMVLGWNNALSDKGIVLIQSSGSIADKICSTLEEYFTITLKRECDSYPIEIIGFSPIVPRGT